MTADVTVDAPAADDSEPGAGPWARFRRRHLFDYNPAATRYWLALSVTGLLCLGLSLLVLLAAKPAGQLWQVCGWLLIVAMAASFPIPIPRSKHSIASGDIVIYLVLALHGAPAAVVAAALEGVIGSIRTSSRLTSRVATLASAAAGMSCSGVLFEALQAALNDAGMPPAAVLLGGLAAAALLHCAISTVALMQVIMLKRGLRLRFSDWYDNSCWVGTLHLVAATLAGMLALNAQQFGRSSVVVGVVVIGLSLALLRSHFRQQIAQQEAQEAQLSAAQLEAQQNQQRFHLAFSQASIGMAIVSGDGLVLQANQALHSLLGYADGGLLQRPFRTLLHAGDGELLQSHVGGLLSGSEERFSIELRCLGAEQREIWISLHCAVFDNAGAGLIFQLHDITSRRRAEGELRHIAYHDTLTDVANRNCFQERLKGAVERSRLDARECFAVMLLDLDRFKMVNDSLGHPAGDALLKEVARRLDACVRPSDLVARLGGDEFAILIEGPQVPGDAVRLGERLLAALQQPVSINGTELRPLASIGLTFSDLGYREPDEVLRDADLAMYQAKAGGKGRLALFDASLHEQLGHKLQLEADLRRAIGDGQLSLAYQPLFTLEPHGLNGFEALARWVHPTRGAISPAVFIALAEETGCIEALTMWAVDEALRQHAGWWQETADHGELVMHVNVSGKDLSKPHFVPHVRDALQRHGVPPRVLVLEITESTLMEHREQALVALGELCALGVKVGIDDFGTGYSSLAYLSTLPFDCLKIDRSFVIGMDKSRQNLEIVRTVISLGRSLNKQVVAEGIETHEQLVRLRQLGATIGQGYLLSRPLGPLQVQEMLLQTSVVPA